MITNYRILHSLITISNSTSTCIPFWKSQDVNVGGKTEFVSVPTTTFPYQLQCNMYLYLRCILYSTYILTILQENHWISVYFFLLAVYFTVTQLWSVKKVNLIYWLISVLKSKNFSKANTTCPWETGNYFRLCVSERGNVFRLRLCETVNVSRLWPCKSGNVWIYFHRKRCQ